jgi:hypothetical protein
MHFVMHEKKVTAIVHGWLGLPLFTAGSALDSLRMQIEGGP